MRLSAAEELAGLHVGTAECNGKILPDDVLPPSTPPTTTPPPRLREGDQARGLVSTVLTSTEPPLTRPARILGILRFFFGVRRRCRVDVSAVDTRVLVGLVLRSAVASSATGLPRFLSE